MIKTQIYNNAGDTGKSAIGISNAQRVKNSASFKESLRQIYNLEQLKKEIRIPPESQIKNLETYDEIISAITKKIASIRKTLKPLEVSRIEEKLQKPSSYKNIALVAHQHFLSNLQIMEEMEKTSENILEHYRTFEKIPRLQFKRLFLFLT